MKVILVARDAALSAVWACPSSALRQLTGCHTQKISNSTGCDIYIASIPHTNYCLYARKISHQWQVTDLQHSWHPLEALRGLKIRTPAPLGAAPKKLCIPRRGSTKWLTNATGRTLEDSIWLASLIANHPKWDMCQSHRTRQGCVMLISCKPAPRRAQLDL